MSWKRRVREVEGEDGEGVGGAVRGEVGGEDSEKLEDKESEEEQIRRGSGAGVGAEPCVQIGRKESAG